MGGYGSGTWSRYSGKQTMDSLKRIEITLLKKLGILNASKSGTLSWASNGKSRGFINYQSYPGFIILEFRFRRNGVEWQPVKQRINLDTTPCNYGGVRYWLLCPNCHRRVGVLCAADTLFLCRHCYQISYDSQNESRSDRLMSQKHKLGARIFDDYKNGRGWRKKKGMHQSTFDRLYARYQRLDYQSLNAFMHLVERLHAKL